MGLNESYHWEVECIGNQVIRQFNEDGSENPSSLIVPDKVVRVSLIPQISFFPRHDVILDPTKNQKFLRRFGRGIMKKNEKGFTLVEYLQCIETTHYRLWVFSSSGQSLVTNPEFELYL